MSKKQKLDEVRKILLALLLARKGATPLPVLERDYCEMTDQRHIPYLQFGYPDLVGFLQSMPEHFIVEEHNGIHYIHGIASEKSKHVSSLVARQKTTTNHPKAKYTSHNLRQPSYNHRVQHMKSQQVKIAPDKLFFLMQYIKSNPLGVSLQNAVAFVQQLVPFINISTQELRTQLCCLSHQLLLDGNMIYPTWNNNQHNTYQQPLKEELQLNELPSNSASLPTTQIECAAGQEDFDCEQYFSDENDFVPVDHVANSHAETSEQKFATNFAQYANCEQTEMFDYNKVKNNTEINPEDFAINSRSNMELTIDCQDLSQIVNDRTKLRLKKLMQKNPEGIWCADLPNVYLHEYKVPLNYTQLGFASVREFTSYLPKIFYMTQINKADDFILFSADKRPVVPETDLIDVTQISHNRYDEHEAKAQCCNDDNAPIPSDVSSTITKNFAPKDVMNYNDNVKKILVTKLQCNKNYLEVYVVEVFHPNFFWIHLRENKKPFYKMMDELSDFYECNKNTYTIAKIALKKDMNCACVYMGRWHRGIIKSVKPDFRVTIFFYDYGTLKTYSPEDIYYLHKEFSSLPAQAIPCGLYNVKPNVSDRWKKSVIDKFIDKIADTLLAATIISVDPTYNSMMVILTDTTEDEDTVINNWLVNERLAQVGKTADAVDMASIMKYVVNNLNQLPTYCFAEENLMPDNCCKATSTKEKYEVSLVSSEPTFLHYDNHHQQQPARPPPGFPFLDEQYIPSNLSSPHDYSFTNASNSNASIFNDAEVMTYPFLTDEDISEDIIKQMYMSIWNENKKLQIRMTEILCDLIERSSLPFKAQIRLNKILKIVMKTLLEQKDDRSTVVKTPSASNLASETLNNVGSAPKTPYNLNSETFINQDLNTNTFSNPFIGDDRPQSDADNVTFSYGSDFAFNTNWSSSKFNPHVQIPPSTTASPAPSTFTNHIPPANTSLPNQNDENIPMIPVSSAGPINTSSFSGFSQETLDNMNTQFASMLKNTNPFKFPMADEMQASKTQNERTSHNYNIASDLSARNPQSHASQTTENSTNIHARSNCFTPAEYVNENHTSRIVYESGPVMYNTQKTKVDARQNARSNNLDNIQNTQSLELGQDKKPTQSQSANDIATSYMQNKVINQTRDNSQVDDNYVTRPHYTQPITNGELAYYQQNSNANNLQSVSSQFWIQNEIPEHWANSKTTFQNSAPLSNHSENASFSTSTSLPRQNCNNSKKSIDPQEMNEATDSTYIFQFKNGRDKQRPMDIYMNFWNNTVNGSIQERNAACSITSFIFQKIDSVKGVTFIFNIEQDGWILTNEFIEAFTNLKLQSCLLSTLKAMNVTAIFKEIHRSEYPIQFSQLDGYPLNVPRDSENRIVSINLISLQNALTLLHKLKIVSHEEMENAKKNEFVDDSILSTLWILIVAYRDLKQRIELCSKYI